MLKKKIKSYLLCIIFSGCFLSNTLHAQIPKSGTYTYNYCDEEYNHCIGKCKIKIRGNTIIVYAPANLTLIKEGEVYTKGTLMKHRSGKWIIVENKKDRFAKEVGGCSDGPLWIDFKRKRFWTC